MADIFIIDIVLIFHCQPLIYSFCHDTTITRRRPRRRRFMPRMILMEAAEMCRYDVAADDIGTITR